MTREEVIKELQESHDMMRSYNIDSSESRLMTALNMAIKALEQEPCEDAIDRSKAIMIASGYCHPANVAKELAKLPSVNPQLCDDAISRQAVLDILFYKSDNNCEVRLSKELRDRIKSLPPVNPTKTGHWILDDDKEHGRCSECGCKEDLVDGHSSYKWCSNCGAKMVEPQERRDKK